MADPSRFVPLTSDEIETAPAVVKARPDGECVVPVPADAPTPTFRHPTHGTPTKVWAYHDAEGAVVFHVCRFDKLDHSKEFAPRSWWRMAANRHEWRWKSPTGKLPLYGLERLAANPLAPVVICEGEKATDAAVKIFPSSVVVCWAGGSNAVDRTDFAPLAGRRVLLWPDNDEPGRKAMGKVASILANLSREVSAIDPTKAAGMVPNEPRATREASEKWDAADAVAEWSDLAALRKAVVGLASHAEPPPTEIGPACPEGADAPLPLFPPLPPAEPFPLNALGAFLAEAASAIQAKVQVPIEIAAQSVLAASALAVQAHADVRLPYGQTRPTSLDFVTIAASGDRKSSADNEALWPVRQREKTLREQNDAAMKEWRIDLAAWTASKKKIEADGKIDHGARRAKLADLGEEPPKPLAPVITSGDATVDGLTKNWAWMHGALGLFTAEGGQFTAGHGMTDDNRLRTAAMLSELWDGKPIMRVRAMDGISILAGRRLSVHLMVQPDAAASFLANETLRDQGLLSRILVAAPASIAGSRLYRSPRHEDEQTIKRYGARLLSILETAPTTIGDRPNELAPRVLTMSADATTAWTAFFDHVERQSGTNGDLLPIRDVAAKAAEHAARLAAVITVIEQPTAAEVEIDAMGCGIGLADWYLTEALRLARYSRTDARLLRAKALLDWLRGRSEADVDFREILRLGPNPVRTKATAEEAIAVLLSHGWVRETSQRPRRFKVTNTEG